MSTDNENRPSGVFIPLESGSAVEPINLPDLIARAAANKWLMLATTAAAAVVSIAWAFLATPIYRAEVILVPNVEQTDSSVLSGFADQFGNLSSMAGVDLASDVNVQEAIATMQSRDFTMQFIRSENLMPILFADEWNADTDAWASQDPDDQPTEWDAYELFDTKVRNVSDTSEGLVILRIDWNDPQLAADWANMLVARLNELMRTRAIDEATANIEYLESELNSATIVELRGAVSRLIENEVKEAMLARVRDQYSFRVIDPAVAPDADQFVRPDRLLIVLGGTIAGFLLAFLYVLVAKRNPS